ncbi:MAG: hypothetical protein WCG25_07435 [bacterium]
MSHTFTSIVAHLRSTQEAINQIFKVFCHDSQSTAVVVCHGSHSL